MEHMRVYLNESSSGTITCPKCGHSRQINFSNDKIPTSVKAKCFCGCSFRINFEKRRYYRKSVQIPGICMISGDTEDDSQIVILDISQGGMRAVKKSGKLPKLDQRLRINFSLNETKLSCVVSICHVKNEHFGAIFQDLDEHSKKTLGFFLLP
ncbi:MAG: PilZ domain-containing protein [Syntrophobacteraceae bacterium]